MRIRDKITTAACLTKDGIEWTTFKLKKEGPELVAQEEFPLPDINLDSLGAIMASVQLPDEVSNKLEGDLTASIRTSELLMRTIEFPVSDPDEIAAMASFQIDKISPYPLDQLAVSHEILKTTENGALVLLAAAKRECIDTIGETFKEKGVHIHSIDARILGWLNLLEKEGHIQAEGCQILVVDDDIDFAIAVLHDGLPLTLRSIDVSLKDPARSAELAEEIVYTLITLDVEKELSAPKVIDYWTLSEIPDETVAGLETNTSFEILLHDLSVLPPLSEGIERRAINKDQHIELIPREWIDHERNRQLRKKFLIASSVIGTVWLCALLVMFTVFQTRAAAHRKLSDRRSTLKAQADIATENRNKLRALKVYTDRSDSALECLLEVTAKLPLGDIEFARYSYDKKQGVTLRGTAADQATVTEYFIALSNSDLFERLNDERKDSRTNRGGVEQTTYSLKLELPGQEEN